MVALLPICLSALVLTDAKSMDFWIGDWDCSGPSLNADGKTWSDTKATNRIDRAMDGKVLHEHFTMGTFKGESWSVFDAKAGKWRQTWVDNQGSYIDLAGGMVGKDIVLTTIPRPKAPKSLNRMIFSDIKPDAFTWKWESTSDGGKNWKLQWKLMYKRKA